MILGRTPLHLTLPAALSTDTIKVTEQGIDALKRAYHWPATATVPMAMNLPNTPG